MVKTTARARSATRTSRGAPSDGAADAERLDACVVGFCECLRGQIQTMQRVLSNQPGISKNFEDSVRYSTRSLIIAIESAKSELRLAAKDGRSMDGSSKRTDAADLAKVAGDVEPPQEQLVAQASQAKGTSMTEQPPQAPQPPPAAAQSTSTHSDRPAGVKSGSSIDLSPTRRREEKERARRMSLTELLEVEKLSTEDPNESAGIIIGGVLNPNWPGRLGWDMGVIFLVLFDAMVLPFQFAYKEEEPDEFDIAWSSITTSFFGADILLSCFTAYPGPDGPVTDKVRIAKNYLRTWFPIDFASTIPWGALANTISGGDASQTAQMAKLTKIVKFVRLLRLMRMLRLAKLAMIWEKVEARLGSVILKQSVALLRVILALAGICHWNACIWWMVGQPVSLFTTFLSDEQAEHFKSMRHWTTVPRGSPGETPWTWLERERTAQYIFCFYWTLGVMRTMPAEVTPENQPERIYVMIFMFFAFSAFAICVALITQTFFKFSERKRIFDDDMAQVRMYMRNLKGYNKDKDKAASDQLQKSVKDFLRHLFDVRKTHAKEQAMLNMLPGPMLTRLKFERLAPKLTKLKNSVLMNYPDKAFYHVSELAETPHLPPGFVLSRKGRQAEACWIHLSGRLVAIPEPYQPGFRPSPSDEPILLVDEDCLRDSGPTYSSRTVQAITSAEVIKIDKAKFVERMSTHVELKEYCGFALDANAEISAPIFNGNQQTQGNMDSVVATVACLS